MIRVLNIGRWVKVLSQNGELGWRPERMGIFRGMIRVQEQVKNVQVFFLGKKSIHCELCQLMIHL